MFKSVVDLISLWALPAIIFIILTVAVIRKIPVYETFIEGAKDGFKVATSIIPYLVAIIVAISMLRASGAVDYTGELFASVLEKIHMPADILPLAFVRSLSGSAAVGVFSDIVSGNDINSYTTKLAAIMLGSSETTFYVLSVYFGSVGIKKYRYAIATGICADLIGIIMAVVITNYFFA